MSKRKETESEPVDLSQFLPKERALTEEEESILNKVIKYFEEPASIDLLIIDKSFTRKKKLDLSEKNFDTKDIVEPKVLLTPIDEAEPKALWEEVHTPGVMIHPILLRAGNPGKKQFFYIALYNTWYSVLQNHLIIDEKIHLTGSANVQWGTYSKLLSATLQNPDPDYVVFHSPPGKLFVSGIDLPTTSLERFVDSLTETFPQEDLGKIEVSLFSKELISLKTLFLLGELAPNMVGIPVFFGDKEKSAISYLVNPEDISFLKRSQIDSIIIDPENCPAETFLKFQNSVAGETNHIYAEILTGKYSKLDFRVFSILYDNYDLMGKNEYTVFAHPKEFRLRVVFGELIFDDDISYVARNIDFSEKKAIPFEMQSVIISPGADNLLVEKFLVWAENEIKPKKRKKIPVEIQSGVQLPMNTINALKNMFGK